jgi:hypothetical protein
MAPRFILLEDDIREFKVAADPHGTNHAYPVDPNV